MAKRVDPLKAKEAKQKKIAIVGAVLLLALLAFQGPKTLKMLKGPQPVATPAATTPAPGPGVDPTATGAVPVLDAAPPPDLAAVADSDLAPVVEQGQLATFERFSSKDPFAQQAQAVEAPAAAPAAAPPAAAPAAQTPSADSGGSPPATSGGAAAPATPAAGSGTTGAAAAPDAGFTTDGSASTEVAAATSISVNGVAEDVAVEGAFPKDEPTFTLVKIAKNGKSVEIGIAGGEYASGGETITLALGKKLTLQNTADGSRYELKLLAVQGYPVPKK